MASPELVGLIPRVINGLFEGVDRADPSLEFSIKVSYVEIYMETIRDLLEPSSINLQLREVCVRLYQQFRLYLN